MSEDDQIGNVDAFRARLQRRTVKLKRPVPAHGGDVSELTIREPVAEDLDRTELVGLASPTQILRSVLAACAGVPPSTIGALSIPDLLSCQEALSDLGFTVSDVYALLGIAAPGRTSAGASPPSAASPSGLTGSA